MTWKTWATFRASDQSESGISGIHDLHGRVGGMLALPGGKKISNLYWNHFFKEIGEVAQFQVILRKDGALQILLRGDGFLAAPGDSCSRTARAFFRGDAISATVGKVHSPH